MRSWKNIFFNITLCFNCLLLLFVLLGDRLSVPAWLQVAGRMHPLLLHFPIVLLIVYFLWIGFLSRQTSLKENAAAIGDGLLLITAFSSALTALMGILLSKEPGYDAEALFWHKWSGTIVSMLSFCWYIFRNTIQSKKYITATAAAVSFLLIVFTGHQGAGITHGQNFLLAPLMHDAEKPKVALENAVVFADMVEPILQAKCINCHNTKKAKGQLVMETEAQLLKGGKHGLLWQKGQPELSLLLKRIHLPQEEKRHMPPEGKPQLSAEESQILYYWIKTGADFKMKVAALPANDTLKQLANNIFKNSTEEVYDFDAADEKKIQQLSNTNRIVHPIAIESPALAVNFYNRQNYTSELLKELLQLKEQIVSLDMAYMPLKEEDISVITKFSNLRKLNLNFTTAPGKSLVLLKQLPLLKSISLAGTAINKKDIDPLARFPKLRSVYLWSTPVSTADMSIIKAENRAISFQSGFMDDAVFLKLTPPILENEGRVIVSAANLQLKHYIKGVAIHYTTDGSEPDSIRSPMYNDHVILDKSMQVKAKAFKQGWIGSDAIVTDFYKGSFKADSLQFLSPPDSQHHGVGVKTLINDEKGDLNFRTDKWLGYRKNKMDVLLFYKAPVTASKVTLTTVTDVGSFIFPPVSIEVWGGSSANNMVRLGIVKPDQPTKMQAASLQGYDCLFAPRQVKFIRLIAIPVPLLPEWHPVEKERLFKKKHPDKKVTVKVPVDKKAAIVKKEPPAKREKAWIFADEIFVN